MADLCLHLSPFICLPVWLVHLIYLFPSWLVVSGSPDLCLHLSAFICLHVSLVASGLHMSLYPSRLVVPGSLDVSLLLSPLYFYWMLFFFRFASCVSQSD